MTTRLLLAYGLMALLAVAAAAAAYWLRYKSHPVTYARNQKRSALRRERLEREAASFPHE